MYAEDFAGDVDSTEAYREGVLAFVAEHTGVSRLELAEYEVVYNVYDWGLNDAHRAPNLRPITFHESVETFHEGDAELREVFLYDGNFCNRACSWCTVFGSPEGWHQAYSERVLDSADYLGEVMGKVPALVIPVSTGRLTTEHPAAAAGYYGSIVPAVWSFQLALRARGLGSCYTTLHLMEENVANEILGMPDDVTGVALLPVAYTKGTDFKPARRGPVERITYFNEWKAIGEVPDAD